MESRLVALTAPMRKRRARGQVMPVVTIILAALIVMMGMALSYGTLTLRAMRVTSVADAAAHAGAMEVHVLPNGKVVTTDKAERVAASFFAAQAPGYARLRAVRCGVVDNLPYCDISAEVHTTFMFSASHMVEVRSVLAYGATRGGQ